MTDLFTRLAERALGITPVVQPLVSPTFAQRERATASTDASPNSPDAFERQSDHAVSDSNLETAPPLPLQRKALPPISSSTGAPKPGLEDPAAVPLDIMDFPRTHNCPADERAKSVTSPLVGAKESRQVPKLPERRNLLESASPVAPAAEKERGDARTESAAATGTAITDCSNWTEDKIEHPVASPLPAPAGVIIRPQTIRPASEMGLRQGMTASSGKKAETAPPVIRVSIGRIEVRAVSPPPRNPQPPSSLSSPRMSLDDYLKQYDGGG